FIFPLMEQLPRSEGFASFNQLGERYGFTGRSLTNLKRDDGGRLIADFAPDLILSIRFRLIFPPHLLDLPRHGLIHLPPPRPPRHHQRAPGPPARLWRPLRAVPPDAGRRADSRLHGPFRRRGHRHRADSRDRGDAVPARALDAVARRPALSRRHPAPCRV